MAYRIKLTYHTPSTVKFKGRDTFRVRIVASDAEDMPNEIFGHQKTLVDPNTSTQQDEFVFVCSPYDLSIYPATTPNAEQTPAFFRKAEIDILVPGLEMAEEVQVKVGEQVSHLITLLNKLDEMTPNQTTWYPSAP